MSTVDGEVVRAAGGVVWRRAGDGGLEVVLIHRPRYDDWTVPKGKADAGEADEDCARREVAEETGLECRLGDELPSVTYRDRFGRPKIVRYWAMEPVGGPAALRPASADEVDEARWAPLAAAAAALTYQRDREVLAAFAAVASQVGGQEPGHVLE